MASTNNFNSKRKRKASFSSSDSSSPRNTNMDGNTSQFIDYLSNVNNHNQTGMSEESLLLSPIFRSGKSDDRVTTPLAKEFKLIASSKMKRRRRSSVLGLQHGQEETIVEMNQSDVFNSSSVVISNTMVTKHDAVRGGTNVNSENGENHKTADEGNVMKGCRPSSESMSMGDVNSVSFRGRDEHGNHEEIKVTTPYWKSTLDESACPSLGLGSIGTEMTCRSSEEYLMQSQQLQDGDCVNVDEATSVHEDMGQQKVERVDKICKKDNHNHEKSDIAKERQSRSKDESGISFDSSLLDQSEEESLQDSMQADEQDYNFDNDDNHFEGEEDRNMKTTISVPSNESVETGDECEKATTSNISPRVSTRVTISPKEQVTSPTKVESTLKDEIDVEFTPHSASLDEHTEEEKGEFVSPSTSIEKIRLGLTPKLKKLREKLIRESMQGEQGDEYASELDAALNTTPIAKQEEKIPTAKDVENDLKIVASDLSLTPALKSFRSKLLRDSLSIGEFDDNPMACLGSPYGHGNNNPTTKDHITEIDAIVGIEASTVQSIREHDDKENVRPWNMSDGQGTRWKEQSEHCGNTVLPISDTKLTNEVFSPNELRTSFHRQPQFLSPSLRQSTNSTTNATSTGSKGRSSKRVVFEDDLYLDQPIDLSSAKKNLNAQSSALVERLRGAAQKRMMSITRTRDSLAMKESMQEQRSMNAKKEEAETSAGDTPPDTLQHSPCETASNRVEVCHDANVDPQNVPIPLIEKRPTTVPISPKLGLRRYVTQKITIPKKQILSSTEKITEGNKPRTRSRTNGSSTFTLNFTKRKPLTIPKSPLLGSRRKSDKTTATKPKSSTRTIHASPPVTWTKSNESISPVGLEFLSRTPPNTEDSKQNENAAAPFTLHTQIRAKERAKYEASRILNEKLRYETMQKERERLLREKYKELDSLKKKLR